VAAHPTPFHIYNEKLIKENALEFQKQFQRHFPQYKNYFAVKATPNPHIFSWEEEKRERRESGEQEGRGRGEERTFFNGLSYILSILKSAGMGADCSSMAELILAERGKTKERKEKIEHYICLYFF